MRVDVIGQAVAQLSAIAANLVLLASTLEMLQPQRVHRVRSPDRLHRLGAHVANDELAAPIEEAGADQSVGIHGIAVEDVWAGVGFADVLLVDALADLHACVLLDVEFRLARGVIFDEDSVAVIAEGVEEFLTLRFLNELSRDLVEDLATGFVD